MRLPDPAKAGNGPDPAPRHSEQAGSGPNQTIRTSKPAGTGEMPRPPTREADQNAKSSRCRRCPFSFPLQKTWMHHGAPAAAIGSVFQSPQRRSMISFALLVPPGSRSTSAERFLAVPVRESGLGSPQTALQRAERRNYANPVKIALGPDAVPGQLRTYVNQRLVAETKGFEPSRRFPAYSLSRGAPSTARPRLRLW